MKKTLFNFLKADLRMPQLMFWDWFFPLILIFAVSLFIKSSAMSKYIFPGLVGLFIMQSIIFSIPYRIAQFNEQGILDLIRKKGSLAKLYISFFLSRILILIIQITLIITFGKFIFDVKLELNIPILCVTFIISAVTFMLLATICGVSVKSQNAALGISQAIYFLLIGTSGIVYPIEKSPWIIRAISKVSPLTYINKLLEKGLYGLNGNLVKTLAISTSIILVLFIVNLFVNRRIRVKEVV